MVNKLPDEYECPFDIILLRFIDTHIEMYSNISPNTITTIGIIVGILSAYNISIKNYRTASLLFLLAYYFDCVDGKVARKYNKITVFGDYYDHVGDVLKIVLVLFYLWKSNNEKFKQLSYILIILLFVVAMHLGCQEELYSKNESDSLFPFKYLVPTHHHQLIRYTKFGGCGTLIYFLVLVIYFWE